MAGSKPADNEGAKCPICGRTTERAYRPFCSRRCADVDLSRWLKGAYAIPDAESEDGENEEPVAPDGEGREGERSDRRD